MAIETADTPPPLRYTWRDLERGTAMLANLLASLGCRRSRVAVQVDKSVEALMLYLAVLRAGHVYLPLNNAYQASEIGYFIGNAEPAVVVCSERNFGWVSQLAFSAGTRHVFTLDDDRRGTLLERAAQHADRTSRCPRGRRPGRHPLHQRHHRAQQGRDAHARQPAVQRAGAEGLLGLAGGRRAGARAAHLPRARPVRRQPRCAAQRQPMIWFAQFDPKAVIARLPEATVFMGVPTLYVRMLARPASRARPAAGCGCSSAARRRC
jgi:malonyl-CoA/methylmalonyl-CoA synthetase